MPLLKFKNTTYLVMLLPNTSVYKVACMSQVPVHPHIITHGFRI